MSTKPMKAVTVCQPYAHLLVIGEKPIENRTWPTSYRGPLAIHAGKSRAWMDDGDAERYPDLAFGAVVGTVELYDCVRVEQLPPELAANEHANGPWCWLVRHPAKLLNPVPARGAQQLWDLDAATLAAVIAPENRDAAGDRARLIDRARKLRTEIGQIFTDAASWNDNTRKPDEAPIDPDPDGRLRRMADGIDKMLATEAARIDGARA